MVARMYGMVARMYGMVARMYGMVGRVYEAVSRTGEVVGRGSPGGRMGEDAVGPNVPELDRMAVANPPSRARRRRLGTASSVRRSPHR
jgi:hypothetical protein